jgi:dipeptidyl aminopeptidase/acylaminoacyl peptidase
MRSEPVRFFSDGESVTGWWRTPTRFGASLPGIVHGPGWFGSKDAAVYERYHEDLTASGFGVLVIDYRGFGDSGGGPGRFSPDDQVADLINSVTYLETRDDVDPTRVGAFGTGATGGGNVVLLAAADSRIRAAVAQFPIADGERWLRDMRTDEEWAAFQRRLASDRRRRVLEGEGEGVDPHRDIMLAPAERAAIGFKEELRPTASSLVSLSAADATLRYRPIDVAGNVKTPLLFIAVEGDEATPEAHAVALHAAVAGPKKLLMQTGTSHYASYTERAHTVVPAVISWFEEHLA